MVMGISVPLPKMAGVKCGRVVRLISSQLILLHNAMAFLDAYESADGDAPMHTLRQWREACVGSCETCPSVLYLDLGAATAAACHRLYAHHIAAPPAHPTSPEPPIDYNSISRFIAEWETSKKPRRSVSPPPVGNMSGLAGRVCAGMT
jgi:hypothetical protein